MTLTLRVCEQTDGRIRNWIPTFVGMTIYILVEWSRAQRKALSISIAAITFGRFATGSRRVRFGTACSSSLPQAAMAVGTSFAIDACADARLFSRVSSPIPMPSA